MLTSVKQIEESLKRFKKKTRDDEGMSDEDKIRMQCKVDVEAYKVELENMECGDVEGYEDLVKVLE